MAAPSRIRLVSPAVDFIDNHLSDHHPAFAEPPTHFDHSLDCYLATPSDTDMALIKNALLTSEPDAIVPVESPQSAIETSQVYPFSSIMTEFKQQYPVEPKGRVEKQCSIRCKASWEEVLEVLETSGEEYMSKSGVKGKIKRAARFVGDKADIMKRVTSVVPDIDYAKPILGALTFLLEAFKQTSKVRAAIKDGLEELKMKFGAIEDYLKLYSTKPKIAEAVIILYVSILKGIEDVIGFYTRNIAIKGLDAVWSGERYEQSLLECLEKIDENGKKLVDAANYSHMEEGHETSKNVKTVAKRADSIKDALNNFRVMFESMAKEHARQMDKKQKENERMHKETQRLARQIELVTVHNSQLHQQYIRATTPQPKSAEPIVTQDDLLEFLSTEGLDEIDIQYIMDSREAFIAVGQDRTSVIMNTSKFREWLVSPSSQELLIHGNSDPQPISPLSFFCAMFVHSLRNVDKFWSVVFFCGCHPYEDYGGARTLITSLIAQLLQKRSFDLSFIKHEHVYQMDIGNVEAFCFVYGHLVRQIETSQTVFCIIDGINFYEGQEELLQETAYVLRFLLDLTKGGVVFKILITSPSTTEDVRQAIGDDDYLPLPEQAPNTQGFSELRFERQFNEKLDI